MGLGKALLFASFVALGLAAAYWTARRPGGRSVVNIFILFTLLLTMGVGLSQREVWPFSTWPLIAGTVPRPVSQPRIVAVDANGREHQIDYRAWGPLVFQEFMAWKDEKFSRLDDAAQNRVAAYLLGIVEGNRRRWSAGEPIPYFTRYLGPLSAPFFLGHPALWNDGRAPGEAFQGLRFYRETWDVEERWRDPSKVTRELTYEYREP